MSVSDPLLKELRDHILDLRRHSLAVQIDDSNQLLLLFCGTLEKILRKGLRVQVPTALGCIRKDYWHVFYCLLLRKDKLRTSFKVATAIQSVRDFTKVRSAQAKGRLLIRVLLKRRLASSAVKACLAATDLLQETYDPHASIVGNEILGEIFVSLLHAVDQIGFRPTLRNASFLDVSWELGVYEPLEFVPCSDLGITIGFASGHVVVTRVAEGSVAAEDDRIRVGDVLDELYGESLRFRNRRFVSSLLKHFEGLPVYLAVVRSRLPDGAPYAPVEELRGSLGLVPSPTRPLGGPGCTAGLPVDVPSDGCGYPAIYLGKAYVGKEGGVLQVEGGIEEVVSRAEGGSQVLWVSALASATQWNAVVEIEDRYVRAFDRLTKEDLLAKHYTEIASCGRRSDVPCVVAIVAGETTCTVARHFTCYAFQVRDEYTCRAILCSIAQGFSRTSWSV